MGEAFVLTACENFFSPTFLKTFFFPHFANFLAAIVAQFSRLKLFKDKLRRGCGGRAGFRSGTLVFIRKN